MAETKKDKIEWFQKYYDRDPTDLELEFWETCDAVHPEINSLLKEANAALRKAVKLAEDNSIPFSAGISPLGQSYGGSTFVEKYGELDQEIVSEIADCYGDYLMEGYGWQHSAVC